MSMNPFEMDDLLGAYALDAVDEDERRAVEDYLAASPRAQAEVRDHREVATMLAWSGMDAPEGLWDRIASSIEGNEGAPASDLGDVISIGAGPRREIQGGKTVGGKTVGRKRLFRPIGAWAVAAAAAALIAVVAVRVSGNDNTSTASGIDSLALSAFKDTSLLHAQLSNEADGSLKVLAVVGKDGVGYLLADGLPRLDSGRIYQLWGRVDGTLISLGLLGPDPGTTVFTVRDDVDLLAITEEVKGGVVSSVNQPVVVGALA